MEQIILIMIDSRTQGNKMFTCPICAFSGLSEDPEPDFGTYEICPCCGCEFGYEVWDMKDAEKYREKWLSKGAIWRWNDGKFPEDNSPPDWNLEMAKKRIEAMLLEKASQKK